MERLVCCNCPSWSEVNLEKTVGGIVGELEAGGPVLIVGDMAVLSLLFFCRIGTNSQVLRMKDN